MIAPKTRRHAERVLHVIGSPTFARNALAVAAINMY